MAERVVLDPSEVAGSRSELDITDWLDQEGLDWGDAEIAAYMADQRRGSSPVDFRVPNRTISGGLKFTQTLGGTTTAVARANIQAKLARFQQEGGWIKRVTNSGGTVYADVQNATFQATSVSGWESRAEVDVDAAFTLEAKPDFYGNEITLSDHTETTDSDLLFTETGIDGDCPARVRIVVDEDDGENQRALFGCIRSRHYSAASTAALTYEAEALDALGAAAIATRSGASGGGSNNVVRYSALPPAWTPVLGTNVGGTDFLTHTGTYRVYARVYTTSGGSVQARLVWDVGDLVFPTSNPAVDVTVDDNFSIIDLGEIRLGEMIGTHRWQGQIEAQGLAGGELLDIDKLWLVNIDESAWVLTAPPAPATADSILAWDNFNNAAYTGALSGETPPLGTGNWSGAGDTDDFTQDTTNLWTQRTSNSDADVVTGRYARLGTGVAAAVTVQADVKATLTSPGLIENRLGIFARYVDVNNWLMAVILMEGVGVPTQRTALYKRVSGTTTLLAETTAETNSTLDYDWRTVKLTVDVAGNIQVYEEAQGASLTTPKLTVTADANLATGGALDDGGYGIYDVNTSTSGTHTRLVDNFLVFAPASVSSDAVLYANQSAQLTTQGMFREDSTGTAYGKIIPRGDLPRLPAAGLEGRTVEVLIKASRGDMDTLPDLGIDDISARAYYRPSWLFVPDA